MHQLISSSDFPEPVAPATMACGPDDARSIWNMPCSDMPMPFVGERTSQLRTMVRHMSGSLSRPCRCSKLMDGMSDEKLSMVDFVSVMMRWNRRIASSNGVAVRFFMPDAHDHGDEHQCAAEQTRSEHRRIEPMTLHTHDNQHDELRQQRRAPTQYSEMLFAYTVRGLFVIRPAWARAAACRKPI